MLQLWAEGALDGRAPETWHADTPDMQPPSLVHGDFRIDNLMFEPDQPRVRAILD